MLPVVSDSPEPVSRTQGFEVHRLKGRLVLENGSIKLLQGVREVFEMLDDVNSPPKPHSGDLQQPRSQSTHSHSKIVLIGRALNESFGQSLRQALSSSSNR